MYHDSKWVIGFFFLMWLAVTGASTTDVFYSYANLGPTKYCIGINLPQYVVVASVLPLVNDTLVFVAITFRLAGTPNWNASTSQKSWIKVVLLGEYLPNFSKAMLRDGQAYYLWVSVTWSSIFTHLWPQDHRSFIPLFPRGFPRQIDTHTDQMDHWHTLRHLGKHPGLPRLPKYKVRSLL